jgi:hypothetical protein
MREKVQAVHRGLLIGTFLTYRACERLFDTFNPDVVFVFNGRTAFYRTCLELARRRGLPVVTHERGAADDTFIMYENYGSIRTKPVFEAARAWERTPLLLGELERTHEYFWNREVGKDINFNAFVTYQTEYHRVRRLLRVPHDAKLIAVFTSSEFELDWCEDFRVFISQLDLIKELIEVFRHRKEYLIIRHHPYLAGDSGSPADYDFISKAYALMENAPPNVRFVMPSERLSSYALFWSIDAALGLLSTTAIEATVRGVATAS